MLLFQEKIAATDVPTDGNRSRSSREDRSVRKDLQRKFFPVFAIRSISLHRRSIPVLVLFLGMQTAELAQLEAGEKR